MIFSLPEDAHTNAGKLPMLKYRDVKTQPCRHPQCVTCQHLSRENFFKSTKTGKTYPLRHNFSCTSRNVVTCSKCNKQYVGLTTQQLNIRINHHRSNIFNRVQTYIGNHFNFSDHSVNNIKVQLIDKGPNSFFELQRLERHWILTLKTVQPLGLNVSCGKIS